MTVSFEQLGVGADLAGSLEAVGIRRPFPVQALTIPDALSGRDVCGKAKTGSGKTLAFGLPLLSRVPKAAPRAPTGLVLVPTRELAVQVEGVLTSLAPAVSRTVAAVYGGVPIERQIEALGTGADVVVATPGRLIDLFERREVVLDAVAVLVLDEADRMADMGFTPQVEWLLRRVSPTRQTMLFSATLDGDVDHLVRHYLTDPVRHEVASERPTVEQMEHRFLAVHQMDKVRVAAAIARGGEKTLVFVRTKHMADRLARDLATEGVRAAAIHGDLRQSLREASLARFASGKLPVLVATDVAARGLDIEAVDTVIHYDPPEDHKAYLHRSGRTARAGDAGLVVTLVLWNQLLEVERVQRRLGLRVPVVEVFSNDPRLSDLAAWDPSADAA